MFLCSSRPKNSPQTDTQKVKNLRANIAAATGTVCIGYVYKSEYKFDGLDDIFKVKANIDVNEDSKGRDEDDSSFFFNSWIGW